MENPYELAVSLINSGENLDKALYYLDIFSKRDGFYASNYPLNKKLFVYYQHSRIYHFREDYKMAISYLDSALRIDPYYLSAIWFKIINLLDDEYVNGVEHYDEIMSLTNKFTSYSRNAIIDFNPAVFRSNTLNLNKCDDYQNPECWFYDVRIKLPSVNAKTVFDNIGNDMDISIGPT